MIGTVYKDTLHILQGNWLKIIGMVILCYLIKFSIETLPIQGSISIRMDSLAVVSSEILQTLLLGALINSILFFMLIDYITRTQVTMRKRFLTAITHPFRQSRLLYKGFFVLIITNLLLYIIGMMSIYAGLSVKSALLFFAYLLLYAFFIWLFLGISQAMYILYDDPKVGIFRCIRNSFSMMKGKRWQLLGLFLLAGVGLILGALLLMIGVLVVLVMYEVGRLAFYRELMRKNRQEEWYEKVSGI
ncbi:DUF975 family protein [Virgibacillus necropolis]|nr:DUF975 family protein [Virgibacillus necropolis]